MQFLQTPLSNHLTLDQVVTQLARSDVVDGLALFGSKSGPVSDYDLLILVNAVPVPIFQMFTHIDGRMADVVFVETDIVDRILRDSQPVQAMSFDGLFVQKMLVAEIVYDASGRLKAAQGYALRQQKGNRLLLPASESDVYAAWFWWNFGLARMKRMAQSEDPVYLTAVDIRLPGQNWKSCWKKMAFSQRCGG